MEANKVITKANFFNFLNLNLIFWIKTKNNQFSRKNKFIKEFKILHKLTIQMHFLKILSLIFRSKLIVLKILKNLRILEKIKKLRKNC
jgi:hypothetical protein